MSAKLAHNIAAAAALAAVSLGAAAEPMILSDETLDMVSAGYALPEGLPTSYAIAYAHTTAASVPGAQVIVNVDFSARGGMNKTSTSQFNSSIFTNFALP